MRKKHAFVEEFSMVPNKLLTLLYQTHEQYGVHITMVGDPNQCSPVEGGSVVSHNYVDSNSVAEMCPNKRTTMEYREDSARYNTATHAALEGFLKSQSP